MNSNDTPFNDTTFNDTTFNDTTVARLAAARAVDRSGAGDVEMPAGLRDPEMRIYAAFVGLVAVVTASLFWLPGVG